jgi:glycosyltransferase involved in cell wall biosynthesis
MRVTMLVRCLAMMRGGGETRHLAWMRELSALGVDVDVITGRPLLLGGPRHSIDGLKATLIRSPYTRNAVYRWQNRRGFGRLTMAALHSDEEWFCRAAWRRIAARSTRPDIVHAHALYQAARLRRDRIPVVINLPGEPHARYTSDLQLADALVADGWAADEMPAKLGRPVQRISKGVDAALFTPDGATHRRELDVTDRPVILSVGRLVPLKNLYGLIDAARIVRESHPSVRLVLVGEGPEHLRLKRHASAVGMADAVTFAGYVPQAETPSYYRTADVFALSSDFDNSPNVVLEAMACGLPVVATNVGGVASFVDPDRGGALVPRGDSPALGARLTEILADPVRQRQIGAFNRDRAVREFSWRASARQLLAVYERIIAHGRATAAAMPVSA